MLQYNIKKNGPKVYNFIDNETTMQESKKKKLIFVHSLNSNTLSTPFIYYLITSLIILFYKSIICLSFLSPSRYKHLK